MARTTHYIELYRVVDYEQQQNLLQLLFGIKTVFVLSRDRTNGCLKWWESTQARILWEKSEEE